MSRGRRDDVYLVLTAIYGVINTSIGYSSSNIVYGLWGLILLAVSYTILAARSGEGCEDLVGQDITLKPTFASGLIYWRGYYATVISYDAEQKTYTVRPRDAQYSYLLLSDLRRSELEPTFIDFTGQSVTLKIPDGPNAKWNGYSATVAASHPQTRTYDVIANSTFRSKAINGLVRSQFEHGTKHLFSVHYIPLFAMQVTFYFLLPLLIVSSFSQNLGY